MSKRKIILILFFLTFLTFGNTLMNGFVGDDFVLIVNNDFYSSLKNFPKLFQKEFLSDSNVVVNLTHGDMGSGAVAYRPMVGATFFFDFWLWQRNPFGYHLFNVSVHFVNTLLVFFIASLMLCDASLALLAAVIFCVHPIQAETVSSIGYRSDLVATAFFLLAFLCYAKRRDFSFWKNGLSLLGAHLFFLGAVFTKESAVFLPGVVLLYDGLILREFSLSRVPRMIGRYLGFLLILVFYLFVYFKVFPNHTIAEPRLFGGNVWAHAVTIGWIFTNYALALIFPWTVKSLPPLYTPDIGPVGGLVTWLTLVFLGVLMVGIYAVRRGGGQLFWVGWLFLTVIPIANIIPLVNPMAYRFMYLPMVPIVMLLALFFQNTFVGWSMTRKHPALLRIIKHGFIVACGVTTFLLNMAWQHPYTMAANMYRDFPQSPSACLLLAEQKIIANQRDEARHLLKKGLSLGLDDARGYYFLGLCALTPEEEGEYYIQGIRRYPEYANSYMGMGRNHFLAERWEVSRRCFERNLELNPRNPKAYGYLIQIYLIQGDEAKAAEVFARAQQQFPESSVLDYLKKIFLLKGKNQLPRDLGQ